MPAFARPHGSRAARSLRQVPHDAETIGVVADVKVVAEASRGADVARLAGEVAAAQDAQLAVARGPSDRLLGRAAIVVVPAILDPFGGVAGGVVEPETVRPERAGGDGFWGGRAAARFALRVARADLAAPPERRFGSRARRIFPFGLAGQSVSLSGLLRQPGEVEFGIVPAHIDHRPLAAAPAVIVGPVLAGAGIGAPIPFGERHLAAADGEGTPDADGALRLFIWRIVGPHDAVAGRQHDQLGAVVAIPKNPAGLSADLPLRKNHIPLNRPRLFGRGTDAGPALRIRFGACCRSQ